jgi:hypothetical protein
MPVIPAMWEASEGRLQSKGSPRQNIKPILKNKLKQKEGMAQVVE